MIYQNLQSELTAVAEQMTDEVKDRRFRHWAKFIDSVDPKGQDGYAFKGDWINDGSVELQLGTPRLTLVFFRHGSMKSTMANMPLSRSPLRAIWSRPASWQATQTERGGRCASATW